MKVAQGTRGVITGDPQAIRTLILTEQPHSRVINTSGFCTDTSFETTNTQSPSFLQAREAHSRLSPCTFLRSCFSSLSLTLSSMRCAVAQQAPLLDARVFPVHA